MSSESLTNQGIYAPTTQSFLNYCLLAVVFGTLHFLGPYVCTQTAVRNNGNGQVSMHHDSYGSDTSFPAVAELGLAQQTSGAKQPSAASNTERPLQLRRLWPVFAAVAFIDVEANTLVTKAYQYTSLTSVTLLDCFTIPCVMILSWLILRSRYRPGHFLGAFCCIAGLLVLVLGDSWASQGNTASMDIDSSSASFGSQPLLGDVLVLLGAVLYSVCNVSQELLLGGVQPRELLAFVGMFGAVISGLQAAVLEHQALLTAHWLQLSVAGPMLAFAAAMFCFYSLCPQVLIMGGAAVLNICLLTSDVWAALARFLWFGGFQGSTAYFFSGSLILVAVGIVVYALSGSPKEAGAADGPESSSPQGVAGLFGSPQYTRLESTDVADTQGL